MVCDEQVQADAARVLRFAVGGDAAVDRDDDLGTALLQGVERITVESVAVFKALGYVEIGLRPELAQATEHQGRGADAVGVVVAEHGDASPAPDGVAQEVGRLAQERMIGGVFEFEQGRLEKPARLLRISQVAVDEQAGGQCADAQVAREPVYLGSVEGGDNPLSHHFAHSIAPVGARSNDGAFGALAKRDRRAIVWTAARPATVTTRRRTQ